MLKDKISSHAVIDRKKMESVKGEEHQEIQKENIHLSNMVCTMTIRYSNIIMHGSWNAFVYVNTCITIWLHSTV